MCAASSRQHDLGPADVLICLGDTGFDYFNDERDAQIKDKADRMGITLLCIRGNHDRNPASLPSYHLIPWRGGEVYCDDRWPSILFARDGSVFDLDGRATVAIGGAYSVDKAYRLAKGYAWFPDEQLTLDEMHAVEQALAARDWRVDTVLSHTYAAFVPQEALLAGVDRKHRRHRYGRLAPNHRGSPRLPPMVLRPLPHRKAGAPPHRAPRYPRVLAAAAPLGLHPPTAARTPSPARARS